jgi:hypothetical protein
MAPRSLTSNVPASLVGTVALLIALGFQSTFAHAASVQKMDLYAVVVGINKYKDTSNNLELAGKDAKDIYTFLNERKHLFGNLHIKLLLDEKATRDGVLRALKDDLQQAGSEDVVLIYLSGHGSPDKKAPGKYYFWPHDVDENDLPATAVWMNDPGLFATIRSERVLLVADACHSGGYLSGLARGKREPGELLLADFNKVFGRFGISAAGPKEIAMEQPIFGNGLFTFHFLRGIRGAADSDSNGVVTVRELFDYASDETKKATSGKQNPQLYCVKGEADKTPVYMVPVYSKGLNIELKFFYEDEQEQVKLLTENSVLKSGQHVGVAFKPDADCFVHILWWDSSGQVGRLFPNPQLSDGTGQVKGGQTHWLPSKEGGKHWYVLDDKPGHETVYFVASRERNPKLEKLYEELQALSAEARTGSRGDNVAVEIEREINLMGFADYTVPAKVQQVAYESKEKLFNELESKVKVTGAEAFFKLRFKHEAR